MALHFVSVSPPASLDFCIPNVAAHSISRKREATHRARCVCVLPVCAETVLINLISMRMFAALCGAD